MDFSISEEDRLLCDSVRSFIGKTALIAETPTTPAARVVAETVVVLH